MKTEVVRFRTTDSMKQMIELRAASDGLTMSALIETALKQYMTTKTQEIEMTATYREIIDRLAELGYTAAQIETITAWWNWREHGDWLMTASKSEIDAASLPAYE